MTNPLATLLQQAQEIQEKLQQLERELSQIEVVGEAGAGLVKVRVTGDGTVKQVSIDPTLLEEERKIVEELVAAALNDGLRKARAVKEEKLGELTASLPFGLGKINLPF